MLVNDVIERVKKKKIFFDFNIINYYIIVNFTYWNGK